jgi:hypothetical protein
MHDHPVVKAFAISEMRSDLVVHESDIQLVIIFTCRFEKSAALGGELGLPVSSLLSSLCRHAFLLSPLFFSFLFLFFSFSFN